MRYFATPSSPQILDMMSVGLLDMIATPRQRNLLPDDVEWCADNGCFGPNYMGNAAWIRWLASYPPEAVRRCQFAVAPDVVGDAVATAERSRPWLGAIRALDYPVAYVAQDGLENLTLPWNDFDVLFIGGTTAWKLGRHAQEITASARERGKPVHMGRVNSYRRLAYAASIGCTSADGTYLRFAPDVNLPKVLSWLARVNA